ncbi:hypothetical protein [Streptomyces sp. NRRL B-24484]|uniref:hypothetical protein n=1 Tax=Streptomyces sp. NRRL B-24484 TaxID=1463833 RepID=UPI0004BF7988|nr:hypothetical protein [Streptomyces sp. NRRL B-24484]
MERAEITEETVALAREAARTDPATSLPELAVTLQRFSFRARDRTLAERTALVAEAADIYRRLLDGGAEAHRLSAAYALGSLAQRYSLAHADDRALATRREAAELARHLPSEPLRAGEVVGPGNGFKASLAFALAEAGELDEAVVLLRDVTDAYRAAAPEGEFWVVWGMIELVAMLGPAGRTGESLDVEREGVDRMRQDPRRLPHSPGVALREAGAALWFAAAGRSEEAHRFLGDALKSSEQLPPEGSIADFGFLESFRASLFARSGVRDEPAVSGEPVPGPVPAPALRPVLGVSFHHWSFSLRESFRAGLGDLDRAVEAATAEPEGTGSPTWPTDPARLAELGTLLRRRNVRRAVLRDEHPYSYHEVTLPNLQRSVDLERRLHEADPATTDRLVRALTDLAMAQLVVGANTAATGTLREAHALATASG